LQLNGRGLLSVAAAALVLVIATSTASARRHHKRAEEEAEIVEEESSESRPGGPTVSASSAVSAYSDTDAVHVISPTVAGGVRDDVAGWSVDGRYLVDAVSAASVDIVSTASGHWTETRHVGSLGAEMKAGSVGLTAAGGFSREPDYLSLGGGGTISFDLFDKNVTPFLGGSYGHDDVGRTGLPHEYWHTMQKGTGQVGATIVVNRSTIAALSFDAIFERGYLAKPYRYIPLFAPGAGAMLPPGASVDAVNAARLDLRPLDSLPDARDRYAVGGRIAHRFEAATVRADQRLYTDSWGMLASTTAARVMVDLGERLMIWPHARFHVQRGIGFWERTYEAVLAPDGTPAVPRYRTGDRELGPLYTATVGGGLRALVIRGRHDSIALTLEGAGIFTRYLDALYITRRRAVFGNLSVEATFE
jgi:hypothetical protein